MILNNKTKTELFRIAAGFLGTLTTAMVGFILSFAMKMDAKLDVLVKSDATNTERITANSKLIEGLHEANRDQDRRIESLVDRVFLKPDDLKLRRQ